MQILNYISFLKTCIHHCLRFGVLLLVFENVQVIFLARSTFETRTDTKLKMQFPSVFVKIDYVLLLLYQMRRLETFKEIVRQMEPT
ncbi:hypothetical protein L2E82_36545 [Cichorium intybus]|uniref:Uncharacterized protein n=1 Tax=Cichorium intybus TaxID=13427 RepID=A0ACB9ACL9_CICIN|nr:hypothetical protein L2E82_36545 [Cichorium intybus]